MISVGSQVLEESKQKVECGSRRQFDDNWVASWRRHSISVVKDWISAMHRDVLLSGNEVCKIANEEDNH